ncbi:tripartite tricarboxylate transporter TctB family protein [Cellvibrio polysaccharolyticus]|uniref:DUF1468 domain-containing protein n=1 Tax=Cellvibrio polysaccharolyticus TaxID=2082724 RepID=A0A928V3V3_9GAMM|nr:tripartite tricarboxylate transporter TctB family protein [Cellvibrio polysaccharolyticus]MBE8718276.1 hypothetical protein [Cellvibrio polysaccharolyticus]
MTFSPAIAERITAGVLLFIAAAVLLYAIGFETVLTDPLGPMFLPRAMAVLLLICALVLLWRSFRKPEQPVAAAEPEASAAEIFAEKPSGEKAPAEEPNVLTEVNDAAPASNRYIAWLLPLLTLLYIPALAWAGFLIATFFMLMALALFMPSPRPSLFKPSINWRALLHIAAVSAAITLAIYVLFLQVLGVPLP